MPNRKKSRLGEILIFAGVITEEQLQQALAVQKRSRRRLGEVLVSLQLVTEQDIVEALSKQLRIPTVDLGQVTPSPEALASVPVDIARRHQMLPLAKTQEEITLAMSNPLDVVALDYVRARTGCMVAARVASRSEILRGITHFYMPPEEPESSEESRGGVELDRVRFEDADQDQMDPEALARVSEQGPVVETVNSIIWQAVQARATDIHLEPCKDMVRVRVRVDGVLRELRVIPRALQLAVVSRIKIMAEMDITEKRRPQDGRIPAEFEGRQLDLRVATLPTLYGEAVNIRILDRAGRLIQLDELGYAAEIEQKFRRVIAKSNGIVLVTGPTGSGKTTTLYALLSAMADETRKIVTVEDPIEYELPKVIQSQINPKAGISFAGQLRAILRHDPDIILVGEVRDQETGDMAMRAALTGHLVFSTLHTNDAPSALTRLVDIGIERYIIGACVLAVAAQRLVRRICPRCAEPYEPNEEVLYWTGLLEAARAGQQFMRGTGCSFCANSGYRNRVAVCEFLEVTEAIRAALISGDRRGVLHRFKVAGMKPLREDGIDKVLAGVTTPDELVRAGIVLRGAESEYADEIAAARDRVPAAAAAEA
jgi:type IV pilus assembly protein PilB